MFSLFSRSSLVQVFIQVRVHPCPVVPPFWQLLRSQVDGDILADLRYRIFPWVHIHAMPARVPLYEYISRSQKHVQDSGDYPPCLSETVFNNGRNLP